MNSSRTVRGILLIYGIGTMLSLKYLSAKFVIKSIVTRFLEMLRAMAQAAQKKAIEFGQMHLPVFQSRRAVTEFNKGFAIVVTIIFLAVALYVAGYILPGALTAMATSALTSVNTGVQTLFQIVGSLIAVIAFILLLLGVARNAFTG